MCQVVHVSGFTIYVQALSTLTGINDTSQIKHQ